MYCYFSHLLLILIKICVHICHAALKKNTICKDWATLLESADTNVAPEECSLKMFSSVDTGVYRYYKEREVFYCGSYVLQILKALLLNSYYFFSTFVAAEVVWD